MAEVTGLGFWRKVESTDPAHTRPIAFGARKFTAIDAHYQIMMATEQWGPAGGNWWWTVDLQLERGSDGNSETRAEADSGKVTERSTRTDKEMWVARVELHTPLGPVPVVQFGCKAFFARRKTSDGYIDVLDEDAPKKAVTDGLTKCLSYLGFSADVFLGRFDDHKYVAAQTAKYAPKASGEQVRAIEDLAAKVHGPKAAAYIKGVLKQLILDQLEDLAPETAQKWITKLEKEATG